jgi:protease-4
MEKRSAVYAFLVFGGLLALCFGFFVLLLTRIDTSGEPSWGDGEGPRVGVVEVKGVIGDTKDLVGELRDLRKNDRIKAIVVRIDSPGGAVAPSQEVYRAILRAREKKKVVCSMGTIAASGGYYIASACDKIYASKGTITGSIGVISEMPHVQGLLELARVQVDTIKSGALKDAGSPFRAMSADEKQYFQRFVNGIYEQFLDDVATARKLDKNELRLIADGRVLTGEEAKQAKLIDEIGNLEDALDGAVKLAGLKGEPVPVFIGKRPKGLLTNLLGGGADSLFTGPYLTIEARDPRF